MLAGNKYFSEFILFCLAAYFVSATLQESSIYPSPGKYIGLRIEGNEKNYQKRVKKEEIYISYILRYIFFVCFILFFAICIYLFLFFFLLTRCGKHPKLQIQLIPDKDYSFIVYCLTLLLEFSIEPRKSNQHRRKLVTKKKKKKAKRYKDKLISSSNY